MTQLLRNSSKVSELDKSVDHWNNSRPNFSTVLVPILPVLFPAGPVIPPLSMCCNQTQIHQHWFIKATNFFQTLHANYNRACAFIYYSQNPR